jgi:hypothetical protein
MDAHRFDSIAKLFADRRLSRRRALAHGGAGLAATGLAAAGLAATTRAHDATPGPPATAGKTQFLFVQSFQQGSIAPKAGADGTYTLTLAHGLGRTIYFTDRPERVVGTSPTPAFLKALGFTAANPPNAALVVEAAPGDEDIAVVELFTPRYEEATHTATYDVQVLQQWERTLAMGFSEQPTALAQLHPTFGAAHLFIDDCPDGDLICVSNDCARPRPGGGDGVCAVLGVIPNDVHDGYCYNWRAAACLPCRPSKGLSPADSFSYWQDQCDRRFPSCNGNCKPYPICKTGFCGM